MNAKLGFDWIPARAESATSVAQSRCLLCE